ncbi:hypothetical protein EHS25_009364 [Saitozyma podzolica]|uniref:FAD/NAD(P)-binding domain-containing protein n=1 Tax=Saitozyma podzolica TaxID=1890683 RepID=A0A427YLN2_9TREE|nr:hypothetical protein EHS25_009364 [Saitozyma podzolica]
MSATDPADDSLPSDFSTPRSSQKILPSVPGDPTPHSSTSAGAPNLPTSSTQGSTISVPTNTPVKPDKSPSQGSVELFIDDGVPSLSFSNTQSQASTPQESDNTHVSRMAVQGDPAEDAFARLQEVWGGHSRSDSDITYRGHGDEATFASAAASLSPKKGAKHSRAPTAESAASSSLPTITIPPIRLTADLAASIDEPTTYGNYPPPHPRAQRVLIIGAGPAGLINARTLVDDGFHVTIIFKESTVGGAWSRITPDMMTNASWGAFTFSGLPMRRPDSNIDCPTVPAWAYQRYLQDFYLQFLGNRVMLRPCQEVWRLESTDSMSTAWAAYIRGTNYHDPEAISIDTVDFYDRVVIATGSLGPPYVPDALRNQPFVPVYHSSELANVQARQQLFPWNTIPSAGGVDNETVLVVGGGRSSMDAALYAARRQARVIWSYRDWTKWFAPPNFLDSYGANEVDILMGPARNIDSWAMWLIHRTPWIGPWLHHREWTELVNDWGLAHGPFFPPVHDTFHELPKFAGTLPIPPQELSHDITHHQIVRRPWSNSSSINPDRTVNLVGESPTQRRCRAIIAATGYNGNVYPFFSATIQNQLGLAPAPPREGWQTRVNRLMSSWSTKRQGVQANNPASQPLVYRGILPVGRYRQRDLAIVGGTRPSYLPGIAYEVESHWVSSLFKADHFLKLPRTQEELLEEIHADNEYNMARYPNVDFYRQRGGTYYVGFHDMTHTRVLLRDMGLDPWRQKSRKWWKCWDWLLVKADAEQYATLTRERREMRKKSGLFGFGRRIWSAWTWW